MKNGAIGIQRACNYAEIKSGGKKTAKDTCEKNREEKNEEKI